MQDLIFQSFCEANMVKICWQFRVQLKDAKISKFGNFIQSWKCKKIWFSIKYSIIIAMDFCSRFWPNSIPLYICKQTLMQDTEKAADKGHSILKNSKKNSKLISIFQGDSKLFVDSNILQEFPGVCGNQIQALKLKESS